MDPFFRRDARPRSRERSADRRDDRVCPAADAVHFDYDLLLLAIPAVLWAKELERIEQRRPLARVDRSACFGWVGLVPVDVLQPALAGECAVDATVIFLAILAAGLVWRA